MGWKASFKLGVKRFKQKKSEGALESLNTSIDSKRREEPEMLRMQVIKALELPPCFFSKIPAEIQIDIFTLVIDKSNARMLALTLVCRNWREIIINTPNLWRHLVLSSRTTLKQVDTWLQRSGGLLSSLRLEGFSFEDNPDIFRSASDDIWPRLDALEVLDEYNSLDQILPPGMFKQLHLQSFESYISEPPDLQMLRNMDTSRTRTLALNIVHFTPSLTQLTFKGLTTLILRHGLQSDIFAIFKSNPLLEIVVLEAVESDFMASPSDTDTEHIELVHLKRLEIYHSYWTYGYLGSMPFPNLEVLKLEHVYGDDGVRRVICSDALAKQTLKRLQSFSLHGCTYSSASLISLLRASCALKELALSCCVEEQDDEESVIVALTGTDGTAQDPLQEACCPLLQHLDLSCSQRLKSGPITRLVKARLASNVTRPDSESDYSSLTENARVLPLPILSLNIGDCPMINPEALPMLRLMVPRLSATPTPVKEKEKRRF